MDFKLSDGFFDLCVNISDKDNVYLKSVLSKLYQLGYRTVAINQVINENALDTPKKKKKEDNKNKESSKIVPDPINVDKLSEEFKGKLCILNRITFICSDPTKTHTLGSNVNMKKYNLYAIVPRSQSMLQFACTQLNADLITIEPSASGVNLNRKLYQQAVERGLCFEIQYADLLSSGMRKGVIYYSHLFYTYGKSMNVIMSSGADSSSHIRNPYDIISLGSLLGLSEEKSKAAMLKQSQLLVLRAEKRKCGKAVFTVEFMGEPVKEEGEEDT